MRGWLENPLVVTRGPFCNQKKEEKYKILRDKFNLFYLFGSYYMDNLMGYYSMEYNGIFWITLGCYGFVDIIF